uniref:CSON015058 protein n=1 Tax=Culicoides sonorensis TaxID=179676 RepID=A0A336LMU9_CULSO
MDNFKLSQNMASSSGISARNSSDGLPGIWQELEQKTGDMIKDWHKLIRANRHSSRESITQNKTKISVIFFAIRNFNNKGSQCDMILNTAMYKSKLESSNNGVAAIERNNTAQTINNGVIKNIKMIAKVSPIGARRVKTDLQTSELKNVFIETRTCTSINLNNTTTHLNHNKKSNNASPVLNCKRKQSAVTSANVATNTSPQKIRSQLPARTTRLLNRRLQNNSQSPSYNGSDSPRSIDSFHRRTPNKPSPLLQRSTEDIDLIDKAMKNSLLQEVSSVKKELLRLRRVLQDEDFSLEMSDTLNPFDTNGQINPVVLDENRRIDALSQESGQLTLMEDQRQELGDLRRQVVYLQSQIDDRDRTIRIQQNQITKYESTVQNPTQTSMLSNSNIRSMSSDTSTSGMGHSVETVSTATQTERLRPISMGPDHVSSVSSRSELPVPVLKLTRPSSNNTNNNPQQHQNTIVVQQQTPAFLKQTQVSSIYTKLSSIKPTTTNSLNNNNNNHTNKLNSYKTVRTTQIGNVMPSKIAANVANHNLNHNNNNKLTLNGKLSNHKSSPELRMMNGTRIGIYGTGAK